MIAYYEQYMSPFLVWLLELPRQIHNSFLISDSANIYISDT